MLILVASAALSDSTFLIARPSQPKHSEKKHGYVHSMYSIYCHLSKINQKHNSPESDSITLVHPSKVRAIFMCPKAIYGYNLNAAEAFIMWEQ